MPRRGPHHHHHHHHHHHRHHREHAPANSLVERLVEIRDMGATEDDLHEVIDSYVFEMKALTPSPGLAPTDPGRGTAERPVDALARARALSDDQTAAENAWRDSLIGKRVLVAGEFPPHLLEEMLYAGIRVTQMHAPTEHGDTPPHFHHLAPLGLRGVTTLQEITGAEFDALLVHGAVVEGGAKILVAAIVPVVSRMLPHAERHVLESDHVAPHMLFHVAAEGFKHIPLSM